MAAKKAARKKAAKKNAKPVAKASVKKRSLNVMGSKVTTGDPFNNQDIHRRLGNFETAGEPSRVGGRTTGIVGQTKQRFRTDKRKTGNRKAK